MMRLEQTSYSICSKSDTGYPAFASAGRLIILLLLLLSLSSQSWADNKLKVYGESSEMQLRFSIQDITPGMTFSEVLRLNPSFDNRILLNVAIQDWANYQDEVTGTIVAIGFKSGVVESVTGNVLTSLNPRLKALQAGEELSTLGEHLKDPLIPEFICRGRRFRFEVGEQIVDISHDWHVLKRFQLRLRKAR